MTPRGRRAFRWPKTGSALFAVLLLGMAPPVADELTIVVLPDTQMYLAGLNGGTPDMFRVQTEWVVANREAENIVFVSHLGDIVQNGDETEEWNQADAALALLEDPTTTGLPDGIPYGLAVGNHDQSPAGESGHTDQFNRYFGAGRFVDRSYFGGHFGPINGPNDNSFQLFGSGDDQFIAIHIEYGNVDGAVLEWADSLLKAHQSRLAIVATHYLMGAEASVNGMPRSGDFSAQGQLLYDRLKHNDNLILMLGGHFGPNDGEARRTDSFGGRVVHSVLSDYQDRVNGGDGLMRLVTFHPAQREIEVRTFSPVTNTWETDQDSQFLLSY